VEQSFFLSLIFNWSLMTSKVGPTAVRLLDVFWFAFSGWAGDRFGRKSLLIASAFLFAVSSLFTGWANTFGAFVLWRIFGGVAIGMASNLSPLYIAEIAPTSMRGRLVSINQLHHRDRCRGGADRESFDRGESAGSGYGRVHT
jgi:MFS family permease